MTALAEGRARLHALSETPDGLARHGLQVKRDGVRRSAFDLLRYPDIDTCDLATAPGIAAQLEVEARYAGYLERQEADIRAFRRDEALKLPPDMDYGSVSGLSNEAREILSRARPETLGAAARLPGLTPAALVILLGQVKRRPGRQQGRRQGRRGVDAGGRAA
jgi:tRNA uridine 5-carboxymethylaminomethyl modification enzyme